MGLVEGQGPIVGDQDVRELPGNHRQTSLDAVEDRRNTRQACLVTLGGGMTNARWADIAEVPVSHVHGRDRDQLQ